MCHNRITTEYEALKPYVCDRKLCEYQYYSLNRGPSLEYEIVHNPQTVDLLVSITYSSAAEGALSDPPKGMGLRVPKPDPSKIIPDARPGHAPGQIFPAAPIAAPVRPAHVGNDGLCDFEDLTLPEVSTLLFLCSPNSLNHTR